MLYLFNSFSIGTNSLLLPSLHYLLRVITSIAKNDSHSIWKIYYFLFIICTSLSHHRQIYLKASSFQTDKNIDSIRSLIIRTRQELLHNT